MRPAQIAREINLGTKGHTRLSLSFNEARANCAGNWKIRPKPKAEVPVLQ